MSLLVKKKLDIGISPSLIYKYYQRKKLIRKPQKKIPWYQPTKECLVVRKPGEDVQIDVKYVYNEQDLR